MVDVSSVVDTMTIGGTAATADATFDVVNPATGEPFATAPDCTEDQLDRAVRSAADAFGSWCVDEDARRQALATAAEQLKAAADDLAPVLSAEQGKPVSDARGEVLGAAAWCQYFASLELPSEVVQDDDRAFVEVVRRPLGVVAAITPWNFPVSLAAWKLAPALLAGNTVVLKPSPYTPLSTLALGALLCDVVPPGVLNVVSGRDPLGAWMTAHPLVRKISFTGSVATGKKVAAAAAPDLKRVTLELGGNDPAILLDDVDPGDDRGRALLERVRQQWSGVLGDQAHLCARGDLRRRRRRAGRAGPRGARRRRDRRGRAARPDQQPAAPRARGRAGRRRAGERRGSGRGRAPDGPTRILLRADDPRRRRPTAPASSTRSSSDRHSPSSRTGTSTMRSRVRTPPTSASGRACGAPTPIVPPTLPRGLEAGTVWVNTHLQIKPRQPFGGLKWSGIGVENGPWGYYAFTDIQTVYVAR